MHHTQLHCGRMRRLPPLAAALVAVALTTLPAAPAQGKSRHLWATINVCDTLAHPDTIGVRGSMPGAADAKERMFMRFRVQYFDRAGQQWHNIGKGGDSGFIGVGPASFKARQAGRLFEFAPPAGSSFEMRGAVTFEWRLGRRVVHREALLTSAGHRSSAGSDPDGYSSDTCVIS